MIQENSTRWKNVKLESIVSFKTGKLNSNAAIPKGKYPFFTCSQETFYTDTYSFDTECVLLGGNNANGIYPLKYFKGKFDAYQRTYVIRSVNEDLLLNRYLFFALQLKLDLLKSISTGAATKFLTLTILNDIDFDLPPSHIQQKIASILSVYDDLIENNSRRIKILEEMAQTIYNEWFVEFRFPGHENVKMVDSELGMIPEGWGVRKLPDLCSKVIDGTHDSPKPSENGYFLVTGKHIVNGFIDFSKCYMISPEEHTKVIQRSKPEKGDIIFSNIGTLGSTVIVDQDFEFSIKNVALFKPLQDLYSIYLYLHFSSPETYNRMERKASGTSQKFFSLNFLRNIEIMKPPKDLLHKFDRIVKPLIEERSMLNKKNQNLRKTSELLLPKLISGDIDVSELDIDTGGITA